MMNHSRHAPPEPTQQLPTGWKRHTEERGPRGGAALLSLEDAWRAVRALPPPRPGAALRPALPSRLRPSSLCVSNDVIYLRVLGRHAYHS